MRKPQRGYARQDRVKEQIMRELAELVRTGLKDPRAGFITINEVEVFFNDTATTEIYTLSLPRRSSDLPQAPLLVVPFRQFL